jgi:hypothetical protein
MMYRAEFAVCSEINTKHKCSVGRAAEKGQNNDCHARDIKQPKQITKILLLTPATKLRNLI